MWPHTRIPLSETRVSLASFARTRVRRSKLGCQNWTVVIYQAMINIKGISSMKLHRDLGFPENHLALGSPHLQGL